MIASKTQQQENRPAAGKTGFRQKNSSRNLLSCLDGKSFVNIRKPAFTTELEGRMCRVETSIDSRLQEALLSKVEEMMSRERYTSRCVGIVVLSADTGRVLSMVSFDRQNPTHNTCISDQFPAASIFKIITAAAAVDARGLNSDSLVTYSGQKHTLYRGQLKETNKRYTHTISQRKKSRITPFALDLTNPSILIFRSNRVTLPLEKNLTIRRKSPADLTHQPRFLPCTAP